jgi:hypothetical protein
VIVKDELREVRRLNDLLIWAHSDGAKHQNREDVLAVLNKMKFWLDVIDKMIDRPAHPPLTIDDMIPGRDVASGATKGDE